MWKIVQLSFSPLWPHHLDQFPYKHLSEARLVPGTGRLIVRSWCCWHVCNFCRPFYFNASTYPTSYKWLNLSVGMKE